MRPALRRELYFETEPPSIREARAMCSEHVRGAEAKNVLKTSLGLADCCFLFGTVLSFRESHPRDIFYS
eukprot:4425222-Pyramimonas_sp.AAC.1